MCTPATDFLADGGRGNEDEGPCHHVRVTSIWRSKTARIRLGGSVHQFDGHASTHARLKSLGVDLRNDPELPKSRKCGVRALMPVSLSQF